VEKEINLKKLLYTIKQRMWIMLVFAFFTGIAGGLYGHLTYVPSYSSYTDTLVNADDKVSSKLVSLIKREFLLKQVVTELEKQGFPDSVGGLNNKISLQQDVQMLKISVVDTDPARAAAIANTVTTVFINASKENYPDDAYEIEIKTDAVEPLYPISEENTNKLAVVGLIVGAAIGIGLVFFLDSLDDTTRGSRETEEVLGIPVLGRVSKMTNKNTNMKSQKQKSLSVRGESIGS
jgi:capsular polysaccharide biosynthesis protein